MGKFITFYGINNIGKSTHAKRLVTRLNEEGVKTKYIKYPIYNLEPTGPFLNNVLRSGDGQKITEDELQLWFVMNRYQFQDELKKMLSEGYVVVAEDYVGTGIAWGMAKGLDQEWLEGVNKFLHKEDFSLLFEGERDISAMEIGHVHEENQELIDRCAETHSHLADQYGWKRIQVQSNPGDTAALVWEEVNKFL